MRLLQSIFAVFATILFVSVAYSAPVTVFGEDLNGDEMVRLSPMMSGAARDSFVAFLGIHGTEDFELFPSFQFPPAPLTFGAAATGEVSGDMMSSTFLLEELNPTNAGRFPTSGEIYWDSASPFSITFAAPVRAFGFFATDAGDEGGQIALSLTDTMGTVSQLVVPNSTGAPSAGAVLFFGFYDSTAAYTRIDFAVTGSTTDVIGYDDMIAATTLAGAVIPEPSTVVLIGAGGVLLVAIKRSSRGRNRANVTSSGSGRLA